LLRGLVRFAVAPPPPSLSRKEPFAAQLALAHIHSRLVPLTRESDHYAIDLANTHGWCELPAGRGLAGYGLARALRILLDVLAGLAALQDTQTESGQPFTHGELVPTLIRVDPSGAARLVPLAPWHWSQPGTVAARERWGHLAPERLLGDAIDQRADVFSAGVLLWEALAGRRLFESDSVAEIITRLMGGRVTLPTLPPELTWALPLKSVAMCALAVDPEQRYASAADFADAIEAAAADRVATHAEVAAYFGARDPHARPSLIEQRASVPNHNSSLSALVSPVKPAVPTPSSAARPVSPPGSQRKRSLWLGAAALSLFVAAAIGLALREHAGRVQSPGAAAAGVALESAHSRALPTPSAMPSAEPRVEEPPAAEATAPPSPTGHGKAPKSAKPAKVSAPKLRAPAKAAPGRDKEAELYGI
jgi:serine/threonine protein kinase